MATIPETIPERYTALRQRVAQSAAVSGRPAAAVLIVAVSKYAGMEDVRALAELGHRDFAENAVQQLIQRAAMMDEWLLRQLGPSPGKPPSPAPVLDRAGTREQLPPGPGQPVRWHMIGRLQRNKARKAVETARLIHSVDSLKVAEDIQSFAVRLERPVDVLLQVNTSGERSKQGCAIPAAPHLIEQIETMVNVRVRGLMTMAPHSEDPQDSRLTFARCRELFEEIRSLGVVPAEQFDVLSMGMSGDFGVAVEEGSNLVRVGAALFGPPPEPTPDDHAEAHRQGAAADDDDT
ncbi:MAG: YggS family pyridoxal phosphate-dependent enzyme [Isosphaera sp.]|nr:YggS family pyridoxal phosphate-dependent enzyme [Isosphaera sp.]